MSQAPQLLLDTTVLIDALRNRNQRRKLLAGLVASGQTLATSTVNVAEVYGGLRTGEEQATRAFLAGLDLIPVSASIAERAGQLKAAFRRQGQMRSITDMIVAATALENGFPVATDNRKDFQIPGMMLFPLP
ncbi:MAG: type II toxin-antitoxin system VapC family toxin [Terracidiphilus sp.]|jgi:predicted nucleic acid-binding protein